MGAYFFNKMMNFDWLVQNTKPAFLGATNALWGGISGHQYGWQFSAEQGAYVIHKCDAIFVIAESEIRDERV